MTSSSRPFTTASPANPHRSAAPDPPGAVLARRGFGDPGRRNGDGWGELEDDWKLLEAAGREQLDDGWPESEKDVFQAALRMVVVKDSR
jgi:hypothetical protein